MSLLAYLVTAVLLIWLTRRWVREISWLASVLVILLPFCFTGYALITDRVYGPVDFAYATEPLKPLRERYQVPTKYNGMLSDVASQIIPWRKVVQWSLAQGEWPIYNPFMLSGDNLAAAAQPAAYSPFTLIACLLPVGKSLTYSAAIALFLAALGAFLFARALGCHELSAMVGAATFMSCSAMTFFVLWPLAFSWALLPLVLVGVHEVIAMPSARSMWLLTTAFVLLLLSGHPETAAHAVFVGTMYALFEMARLRTAVLKPILFALAAGAIALAICAVYVIPIIDVAPQSAEYFHRTTLFANAPRGVSAREVLARIGANFFPFLHTRRWLLEGIPGMPFDTAIVGSVAIAAAVYGLWRRRSSHRWFLAGLALFGILANADWAPLSRLLQRLPILDIALNERFSFAAAFALAALAALGVEELLQRKTDPLFAATAGVILALLLIATRVIIRAGFVDPGTEVWDRWDIVADVGGLSVIALLALTRIPARFKAACILGIILLQRAAEEHGLYPVLRPESAYPPVAVFETLKEVHQPFRVTGGGLTLLPNMSALYELEDVRGYQAMTNGRYVRTYSLWSVVQPVWFNKTEDLTRPFLSFLNVRYAVVWPRYDPPPGWRIAAEADGTRLLENLAVVDRAFVPRSVSFTDDDEAALQEMARATDFRKTAWLAAGGMAPGTVVNGPGSLRTRRTPHGYHIDAEMDGDGWIVISETMWKGWRAYVDDRAASPRIANTAFLAVYVPAGRHRVELEYLPRAFVGGRIVSLTTLGVILLGVMVRRLRRMRSREVSVD